MGLAGPDRPRVSRETRLLLATIFISIAALWALARLRFPERPVTTNPVPPLLTQLSVPPRFDDLASEISQLDSRLLPSLVQVGPLTAVRVRDSVGAIFLAPDSRAESPSIDDLTVIARDSASGLTLVSVPAAPAPELTVWTTAQPERSRYMIATDVSAQGVSLRPVFVGRLHPVKNPAWPDQIWTLPARTNVSPGDFLFATDGTLAGLVITHAGSLALVPANALLAAVNALFTEKKETGGWLGVEVQALPRALTTTGARGVMIAWVDPSGPAADKLFMMDVIEAAGGARIASPADWRVQLARTTAGSSIVLRVRRGAETSDVSLTAASHPSPPVTLGLTMRTARRAGVEILQVAEGSSASRAGLRGGDLITAIGDIRAPTAQQITKTFDAMPSGGTMLVAITRGNLHRILTLEKQ